MFGNPVTNPKGWKTSKIKDVAPESPSKESVDGRVWLLNLDMIESNTGKVIEKVYEDSENALSVQPFDEGNVLFSKLRPYLNKVVIPDEPGLATTELVPLRPKGDILNKIFLSHLLRGDQFVNFANDIAGGTKMPRMPLSELRKFECILPPMEEQMKFVAIAEQADKSEFVGFKSRFIEMFGDTHVKSDNSRQWKEVVEIINGKDYKTIQVEDGGYPVYGTGGEMARAADYLSPANSILLGRKGTIDKPLLIKEKYWNVDTAFGAVPDENILNYVYFYWHCKTIDFNILNKGTTLPSTTKVDLLNLWVKIPAMEEQNRFASIVEQADKSEYYNQTA